MKRHAAQYHYQQRFDAMGCVNPLVITPGIDSLAREGILYDQAICQCPMCVPSRNSLMMGMYASQTGVRSNRGALLDETRLPAVPLPQLLHDAGYFCAGFGKTHWNHARPGEMGSRRGFDVRAEGQSRKSILCEEGAVMMDDEDPEGLKAYYEETGEFGSGEENALGRRSITGTGSFTASAWSSWNSISRTGGRCFSISPSSSPTPGSIFRRSTKACMTCPRSRTCPVRPGRKSRTRISARP